MDDWMKDYQRTNPEIYDAPLHVNVLISGYPRGAPHSLPQIQPTFFSALYPVTLHAFGSISRNNVRVIFGCPATFSRRFKGGEYRETRDTHFG